MNIYSIEIKIIATAYITAENPEQALNIARGLKDTGIELSSRHQYAGDGVCIDGGSYEGLLDNDEDVALSPAMTIQSLCDEDVDLVEEFED